MKKILITGGSGFIGGHFDKALAENQLINMDLVKPTFEANAAFVQGDIRKEDDIRKALEGKGVQTIISLAAKHHDFGIGHDQYFDTNEDGTKALCNVASEFNIKEIIFYSSVAVYGLREEVSTEKMSPQPDSPYGASKLAGEKVLENWAQEDPSRKVIIIRPALVFGPNNMANMRNLISQIDSGLYFHLGDAQNIKSIAYVENLVSATVFLIEHAKPGVSIYNYADAPQLSARDIGNTIARFLGKKIHITVPKSVGLLMGLPFDLLIKLTGKNFPISTARIKKLGTQTHHSPEKILSEGFKPTYSTVDGIQKMVEWYKSEKNA